MENHEERDKRMDELNELIPDIKNLEDDELSKAHTLLFGDWHKDYDDKSKALEMKSIFNGGTMFCLDFIRWVRCINYLNNLTP